MVETIRTLCKEKKMSMVGLNKKMGWPRGTIDRWDVNRPSVDKVAKVADELGTTVDELIRKDG